MKIAVIANCQCQPIAKSLASIFGMDCVIAIPIHLYGTKHFELPAKKFYEFTQGGDCVILTFQNAATFGSFSSENLKATYDKVFTITNIYFTGIHPDITYVGDRGGRLQSPVGDYHSRLVLHSYLTGRSVRQCLERFTGQEYRNVGFFEEYDKSAMELMKRDLFNSIPFAKRFLEIIKEQPSLYTINHPTGYVFQEFTQLIIEKLSIKHPKFPYAMLPNYLANSVWWPIYPEIADMHGLKYSTPMLFKQPDNIGGRHLSLIDFIASSYNRYSRYDLRLRGTRQADNLIAQWGI